MLKLLGAIMMLGATAAIGASKIEEMNRRVRILEGFSTAIDRINAEIDFNLTPLPELIYLLARSSPAPVDEFFKVCLESGGDLTEVPLETVWQQALSQMTGLLPEDKRALSQVGSVLGRFDPENQRQSLTAIADGVKKRLKDAEERRKSQGKSCAALAAAAGLALVVIFV